MILTDENGKRYNATCVGTHMTRDLYEIEEIAPAEKPWWEKLPPHTPVQVRNDWWSDDEWLSTEARYTPAHDHVRWPPPRDGWKGARERGLTHLAVLRNGGVHPTRDKNIWPDDAVLVPIPQDGGQ